MKTFPDLGKYFTTLKLLMDVEQEVRHNEDAISLGIRLAILEGEPAVNVIAYLKQLCVQNMKRMFSLIGENLVIRICLQ